MFLTDYHTHSALSFDARTPLTNMALAARDAGVRELCVTDHYDLLDPDGAPVPPLDWAPALKQFRAARAFVTGITLKLGIELGAATADPDQARAVLDQPELDFVVGSIHNYSVAKGGRDLYYSNFCDPAACHAAMDDFLTNMLSLARMPECYDVLGHIIYLLRYMPAPISLDSYWERIVLLLKTVIENGRGIELNLYRGQTVREWENLLWLYHNLGGEIVTIGTDAHHPSHFAGHAAGQALLRECGFRYICTFEKRTPSFHKL